MKLVIQTDSGTELTALAVEPHHFRFLTSGRLPAKGMELVRQVRSALLQGREIEDNERIRATYNGVSHVIYVYGACLDSFPSPYMVVEGENWRAVVANAARELPDFTEMQVTVVDVSLQLPGPTIATVKRAARQCGRCDEPALVILNEVAQCPNCLHRPLEAL